MICFPRPSIDTLYSSLVDNYALIVRAMVVTDNRIPIINYSLLRALEEDKEDSKPKE